MTYVAACIVATLLLAVFVLASVWMHLARDVQHRRHKRELATLLEGVGPVAGRLELLRSLTFEAEKKAVELQAANLAGQRLDETMRRTIGEGIDLAKVLDTGNTRFCELVAARQEQRAQEDSTLLKWAKIRDDLEAFYESYPPYVFGAERGQG